MKLSFIIDTKAIKENLLSLMALLYIFCGILIAIFCYVIAPDNSINANTMHLSESTQTPGSTFTYIQTKQDTKEGISSLFTGKQNFYEETAIDKNFSVVNDTIYAKKLHTKEPIKVYKTNNTRIITKTYLLGTDKYGRDFLSRLLIGSRISFSIGFIAVLISLIVGLALGALAGYYGKWIDTIIMWFINVTWSIPTILLVIAITVALGKGLWQIYLAVGLTMWVEVARVVRGQIISIKNQQYIEATKVLGISDFSVITKHILPNIIGPIIVISASNFATAILVESGLSFLGLGAQPPTPSWGIIIKNHYNYLLTGKAFLAILPGLLIVLLVLSFMILGNSIRDYYNVKK